MAEGDISGTKGPQNICEWNNIETNLKYFISEVLIYLIIFIN